MSRIETIIRETVESMGLPYLYERWQTVNIHLDAGLLPVVVNVLPVSGVLSIGRMYRDAPNCAIAFLDKSELDFDAAQNEDVVERCKERAQEFIARLNASGRVYPIEGDVTYSVVYDRLDTAVTGVIIECAIKERVGICPPNIESNGCGCV